MINESKRALMRLAKRRPRHRHDIMTVVDNPDMLNMFTNEACSMFDVDITSDGEFLKKLFQLILDHQDQILALIAKILVLFAGKQNVEQSGHNNLLNSGGSSSVDGEGRVSTKTATKTKELDS